MFSFGWAATYRKHHATQSAYADFSYFISFFPARQLSCIARNQSRKTNKSHAKVISERSEHMTRIKRLKQYTLAMTFAVAVDSGCRIERRRKEFVTPNEHSTSEARRASEKENANVCKLPQTCELFISFPFAHRGRQIHHFPLRQSDGNEHFQRQSRRDERVTWLVDYIGSNSGTQKNR